MEQNVNQPQVGMSMKNPSLLKEGEFPLAVNGILQSVNGNFAMISNDHSNILATKFKDGFKVIGTNYVPSISTTFFFLVNPVTGESEIGFIYDSSNQDKPDASSPCPGCDYQVVEDTPLEQTVQNPVSTYYTFVNANCLNFDIDHPVTSWFSVEDCNITMYFNDFKNPPRYIDYEDFQKIAISNCPLLETDQLDCDKILVFPESCYPIVEVVDVVSGGQNTAGVYQFAVCYADVASKKITDYFYVSNPTPLYDQAIIPNANTAYPIAKSFKLQVTNLNTDFQYINIAVLKTINNITSVYLIETFDIKSSVFEYIYTGVDRNLQADLSIDEIIGKRPYYNKAKITTESNGYLFMANLEEDRILNLQPVVSQIPLYWQTVEMNEGDYANPIIAQNYVGYLGDEVYPFGIAFTKTNGKQTAVFPFVGREITQEDQIEYDNNDVIKDSSCSSIVRNKKWEVYNTASFGSPVICPSISLPDAETQTITDSIDCYSDVILYLPINPNIPTFYSYPPPTINYPPQDSNDVTDLLNWMAGNQINNIATDQTTQTSIGLCDCEDIKNQYPPSSNPTVDPIVPINIDPNSPSSSLEILQDPDTFVVNTYSSSPFGVSFAFIQKPSGIPPSAPDPCKNYSSGENDNEKGYLAWISAKENDTPAGAILISQSTTTKCSINTWGSFITDIDDGYSESWYQFYVTNQDGVASVVLSTDRGNCSTNGSNNSQVFVYASDQFGNPLTVPITPIQYDVYNNRGIYVLLTNLIPGALYFVKVTGNYEHPFGLIRECCKQRTFNICINSPKPSSNTIYQIPGTTRINKICNIKYEGVPQNSCKPRPYEYGTFAYWESIETYPCNEEVWGDLAGKPIRHFKFPDNSKSKFFKTSGFTKNDLSTKSNKIYPKGVTLNINNVKNALVKAVELGLITEKERSEICGYRIYRGNRRGNESIIAKGLLYDVWQYKDNIYNSGNQILFPNFPFNDNGVGNNGWNIFLKNKRIRRANQSFDFDFVRHPFGTLDFRNNKYTFDAPNLSFNNPGLGTEIKLEGEQSGRAVGNFVELRNNTKYQYIGPGIISAAVGFATIEASQESVFTMVNATLTQSFNVFGTGTTIPLGLIFAIVSENILAPVRIYSYYSEWYEIIKKFAPFRNYAVYYSGVGNYIENDNYIEIGNVRRTILNTQYLKPGILNVKTSKGNTRFNNFKRDSSVFIELQKDTFFSHTATEDKSRRNLPACYEDLQTPEISDICSYYASMKNLLVSQYGQIDNIEWIDTGYNGRIEWGNQDQNTDCDTIFGGDTYITRFTKKRKVPMFMEDRVIQTGETQVSPVNQDIQLSLLPNIGYPRFWMDYPLSFDYSSSSASFFGDVAIQSNNRMDYNFACKSSSGKVWKDVGIALGILSSGAPVAFGVFGMPLAAGITIGAVESNLGSDVFIKGKYVHSFYGITSFLCESNYNLDYRHGENIKEKNFYPNVGDTNEWTQEFYVPMFEDNYFLYNNDYSKQNTFNPNFVLNNDYSQEDSDCETKHPNRVIYSLQDDFIFLANNFYEFPRSGGKLLILKGIENNKVLAVQENRASIFNSYITLETNVATATVGSNTLFNQQSPVQFIQTDLGFGGSQTPAVVSTEFGHYWVDNKRGQVLVKTEGIQNIVKPEEEWWFKENLPFKILKDFPEFDITNNFKYIGMAITYDARYKRIFFTKRDVELRPEYKGLVQYNGQSFIYKEEKFDITASKYFCNKSWTLSYNPLFKNFVSFHTFTPNYYTLEQAYFSSGVNYSFDDPSEEGLWHHNLTNKSYQVYYGKLKPFIFEFSIGSKYANKVLEGVEYISEFYRFQDNLSSYLVQDKTYNKALVYNQNQTSGLLELVPKQKNNRMQFIQYPKQKPESREILVENIENLWRFNNFFNVAQLNGQPILTFDCDNIAYRSPNPLAIRYNSQYLKDLMRSDYHVIRLINDKYSNYNILQRFSITKTNNSPS